MIKDDIIKFCNEIGLDTIGFIKCRKFNELESFFKERKKLGLQNEFEEDHIEKRINPNIYMEQGKTIISIAFPYFQGKESDSNGFSIYTKGLDYHRVVNMYLKKICDFINENGGEAISLVDSNSLPERYIAYLAGIGFIGKNNMIITKKYGSYVFLGEIITDLDIADEDKGKFEEIKQYKDCGACNICYGQCPSKSINGIKINSNICLSYITQKKDINKIEMNLLKGNIFGCDFCQLKCPYNSEVKLSNIPEFKAFEYMKENSELYANMDNKLFKEKIKQTSCGWRGKNVIRRNSIIRLYKEGYEIEGFKGDSPYINEYIDKLIENRKE